MTKIYCPSDKAKLLPRLKEFISIIESSSLFLLIPSSPEKHVKISNCYWFIISSIGNPKESNLPFKLPIFKSKKCKPYT